MPKPVIDERVSVAIAYVVAECGRMVPKPKALLALPNVQMVADWYPDDRIHKAPPSAERANFRSATPRGFAHAVFLANAPHLNSDAQLGLQLEAA